MNLTGRPVFLKGEKKKPQQTDTGGKAFMSWLHLLECCVTGMQGPIEAHHLKVEWSPSGELTSTGRLGKRSDDWLTLPLLHTMHNGYAESLHNTNEAEWWGRYGLDPHVINSALRTIYTEHNASVELANAIMKKIRKGMAR